MQPKRVAFIGNFRTAPWTTENHLAASLESLGVKVLRVQEDEIDDWYAIPARASNFGAAFIMWTHSHGWRADPDEQIAYLERAEELGVPTVGYHLDRWWGLPRQEDVFDPYFQQSLVVTADGGHEREWADIGVNHYYMPPAVLHSEVGRGDYDSRYGKDVGFVGSSINYGHGEHWTWRYDLIVGLNRRYRSRFRIWPRARHPIRGRELNNLYASCKVIVGDSCLVGGAVRYTSDRLTETLGRGGFLIYPRIEGITDGTVVQEGEHLACFDVGDLDGVYALVDKYVDDDVERRRMTDNAIAHIRAHHTYRHRMTELFGVLHDQGMI